MKATADKVSLASVASFYRGLTYSKADEVESSRTVVLRANNVDLATNSLNLSDLRYIRDTVQVPDTKKVRRDTILICTASGSKGHLGKAALVDDDYDFAFGGFMGLLVPGPKVLAKFLLHALSSAAYRDFINALTDGANINNLKFDDLGRFEFYLPPLPEQRRIVALLDEAFEGIAKARTNAVQNIENARAVHGSVRSMVFGRRHGDWHEVTLDRLSENLDSKRVPITKAQRVAGPYPYYGASGVVDHVASFIFDEEALLISEDGANLISRTTPIAFSVSGKYWVNNHAHILRFRSQVTQRFVEAYIESISIEDYVTGAAQPKLTQKALNSIPIPIPKSERQQADLLAELDGVESETDRLQQAYAKKLAALDELKKSLLHHAFAGEL